MPTQRALPVIFPNVPAQRWSCHSCTDCCRILTVHLSPADRVAIDAQNWSLDRPAYVRLDRSWVLNKGDDGACVFLDRQTRYCRIHERHGPAAKPLACRLYPFTVHETPDGWRAALRFDCPSVARSRGLAIGEHRREVSGLVADLPHKPPPVGALPDLVPGLPATAEETEGLIDRVAAFVEEPNLAVSVRLKALAWTADTLAAARYDKVRGSALLEMADLLLAAAPEEVESLSPPTPRQLGLLRQLVLAHAETATLEGRRAGIVARGLTRWRQFRAAGRMRRGDGLVPRLPGIVGDGTFEQVEAVGPAPPGDDARAIDELLVRYLLSRLRSRTCFGPAYYGWPIVAGLQALAAAMASTGWLARRFAAARGTLFLGFDDAMRAIGRIDQTAGRAPVLGTQAERLRLAYWSTDAGIARLLGRLALT